MCARGSPHFCLLPPPEGKTKVLHIIHSLCLGKTEAGCEGSEEEALLTRTQSHKEGPQPAMFLLQPCPQLEPSHYRHLEEYLGMPERLTFL